jgi:primosomal protein N' (replication factor Y)
LSHLVGFRFAEVLLPRPLANGFTYEIPTELSPHIRIGTRVLVQFGPRKIYSAIVIRLHNNAPDNYEPKQILEVLGPVIDDVRNLQFWQWMAEYYMCTPGEVMNVALPSRLKLESETQLQCLIEEEYWDENLEAEDREILTITRNSPETTLNDLVKQYGTAAAKRAKKLVDIGVLGIKESIKYHSLEKWIKVVHINAHKKKEIEAILHPKTKAKAQQNIVLAYYQLQAEGHLFITREMLLNRSTSTIAALDALVRKNILEIREIKESALFSRSGVQAAKLTEAQQEAYEKILKTFAENKIALLHGITSSGKTELYVHLMKEIEKSGGQCLMLVPEIALTTQLINRLRHFFGERVSLYHSRMTDRERSDVWESVRKNDPGSQLVVGARSAIFLPFSNLKLIIIDEEHDSSYRQDAPNPRYQGRDSAIYLATLFGAHVLLGTATPSVESYFNTLQGKYGLIELHQRYEGLQLPEVHLINIREEKKKNRMKGNFSQTLIEAIDDALRRKKQTIIFQNRRGYSPKLICEDCGTVQMCDRCDISLTIHKAVHRLKCHYCGREKSIPPACVVCGSIHLKMLGAGTEQIEDELSSLFPGARIERLDLDTAQSKKRYNKMLTDMESGQIDILVGTQMVTKGLNFTKVEVVGVVNADNLLYFPEYRAHERAFQLLEQVAGRSGRSGQVGKVFIQTYNTGHPVLTFVKTHDYKAFYEWQSQERKTFLYPPFVRMIHLMLRHKDLKLLQKASIELTSMLKSVSEILVIGPEFPPVNRVNNYYRMGIFLKIPRNKSYLKTKRQIWSVCLDFFTHPEYKTVKFFFEVDA